jgi:hypothetical protein
MGTKFWSENFKGRDLFEGLGVDERMIIKYYAHFGLKSPQRVTKTTLNLMKTGSFDRLFCS